MEVDPNALETFEISREEAKNRLNSQFGQVLAEAKGKLTKAEETLIKTLENDLKSAQTRIKKEIEDIDNIVT